MAMRPLVPRPCLRDKPRVAIPVFQMARRAGRVLAAVGDAVLPPRCAGCGVPVDAAGHFCAACWRTLAMPGPPWCAACNLPFGYDRGEGALCSACAAHPPRHAGVRAAVEYGAVARTLALRLKYGVRPAYADAAARQMLRHLPPEVALIVPVPLHRRRLWARGYNQAALIASALSRRSGVPADPHVLERHRATPPLKGHGREQRRDAVRGAFRLAAPERVAGRRIALVDDVYTTGATAEACVGALLDGEAASVVVLAWARVIDPAAGDD